MTRGLRSVALIVLAALVARAARADNHPELQWHTVETEHFTVHFHEGAEATARQAAEIAETIYGPVTRLYAYEPAKKTHLVLADYEDYANGAAYFFDGRMEIWATNLEFDLRGTTQWLWNVVTHEFVHMVNIQASQRTPSHVPAIYFQWFDYESERRTDVLTGYPNTLVSYPLSGVLVPAWFAEGTAQYMTPEARFDHWDAHRDMIVRTAALEGKIVPYERMSLFAGSLESEKVYDHGFSLVRYIAREHGTEAIAGIVRELGKPTRLSAEGAFRAVTGRSGRELYDAWRAETEADAAARLASLGEARTEGSPIGSKGTYNIHPRFSPDGATLAWLSNGSSPFHRTSLVAKRFDPADPAGGEIETLVPGATGGFSFSPDGGTIYFARREEKDRFGSVYFDLFAYDVESEEETRLTRGARLRDPAVSPDGTRLVAVRNSDGTNDLALVSLPAEKEAAIVEIITESPFGRQLHGPRWHPDGRRVLVDVFEAGGDYRPDASRDVMIVEGRLGARLEPLFASASDERSPVFLPASGDRVLFTCDAPGSGFRKFDVYAVPMPGPEDLAELAPRGVTEHVGAREDPTQVTNVIGGAFYPDVSPDGSLLAFAAYTAEGYRIHVLPMTESLDRPARDLSGLARGPAGTEPVDLDWRPEPYRGRFGRFLVSPRLVVDEGRVKVGVYGSTADVLDKQSLFGGFAFGQKGDLDLFVLYENRFFWPTFFAEAFWVRKNRDDSSRFKFEGLDRRFDLDLRYDAFEIDAGFRFEKGNVFSPYYYREFGARYRNSRNHLNLAVTRITPSGDLTGEGELLILPKDGWDYYRAHDFIFSYNRRQAERAVDVEINPVGRELSLVYTYSLSELSPSGTREVDDAGIVRTVFEENTFHQIEGAITERRRVPITGHTLDVRLSGGWIDRKVDDFFWFRLGSRPGLRGYTYYSIEGRAYAMGRATYRFPILGRIGKRFLQLHFERLYGGVFYESAVAWKRPIAEAITLDQIRRDAVGDVGLELRLDLVSFYTFPARVHFEAAYPLDRVQLPASVVGPGEEARTTRDWKFYFGVLFGY